MTDTPIRPPDNTPPYMYDAWCSCLMWAVGEDDIVAAFRRDTGIKWAPGKPGIERLIDKQTGAELKFVIAFVAWFNEHVWGDPLGHDDI